MLVSDLAARFRSQMRDEVEPYLWSDDDILSYMGDAQEKFVLRTGGIADSSSYLTQISLLADKESPWYDFSPRIFRVRDAWLENSKERVKILNLEDFLRDPKAFKRFENPARVRMIVVNADDNRLQTFPRTNEDETLRLSVLRLPELSVPPTMDSTLEIADQYHLGLLDWMIRCALLKQDAETFDYDKSTLAEQRFSNFCEESRREIEKRRYKVHVVRYGGI
jgi:hypothetical protein